MLRFLISCGRAPGSQSVSHAQAAESGRCWSLPLLCSTVQAIHISTTLHPVCQAKQHSTHDLSLLWDNTMGGADPGCLKGYAIFVGVVFLPVSIAGIGFSVFLLFGEPFASQTNHTYRPNWEDIGKRRWTVRTKIFHIYQGDDSGLQISFLRTFVSNYFKKS